MPRLPKRTTGDHALKGMVSFDLLLLKVDARLAELSTESEGLLGRLANTKEELAALGEALLLLCKDATKHSVRSRAFGTSSSTS